MDRRDAMAISGSASYFIQRGMTGSGSGTQSNLHGPPGMHQLSNPNLPFQNIGGGSTVGSSLPVESSSAISPHSVNVATSAGLPQSEPAKRKRGRPRKYGPDGTVSLALSSSVSPHSGNISPTQKRGRGRPPGTGRKQQLTSVGKRCSCVSIVSCYQLSFIIDWLRMFVYHVQLQCEKNEPVIDVLMIS